MSRKLKTYLLAAVLGLSLGLPSLTSTNVVVASHQKCNELAEQATRGAEEAAGQPIDCYDHDGVEDSTIYKFGRIIVNIFSIIVGAVAIIMIIYGGLRYITSGGNGEQVGGAKNVLIYAVVGLVVVALAQVLVHFVLKTSSAVDKCPTNSHLSVRDRRCRQ